MADEYQAIPQGRIARFRKGTWGMILWGGDKFVDAWEVNLKIMIREKDLFLGTLFFLLGLLDFHSGKYCDGNTADYLSCTRPVTYYYYTWLEIILIILGIFLVMLWFLKRRN